MSSGDDDFRWNVFRSHKRATTEKPSLTPWMITSLQATKLLLFLMCNTFLTFGAAISKVGVLVLATNLWDRKLHWDPYARRCSRVPVQRTPRAVAAMYLALFFIQAVPDILAIIRSLMWARTCHLRRWKTLRAFGLSLLVFTVFPQLDLYRCLCLCACFPIITALQRLLSTISSTFKPGRPFGTRIFLSAATLPHLILFLALFSATYLWNVMETPFQGVWVLPFGLFAISIGFWESWVTPQHTSTVFHELYQVKYGLRKMNISTRMVIAICRFIVVMSVMIYSAKGRVKPYLFFNVLTSYSFSFRHTRILLAAVGVVTLNYSLRGCARFLAAIGMKAFSLFHPVTIVPAVGYAILAIICNQRICGIAHFLARTGLRWSCDQWGRKTRPFDDWYICMIWLAVGAYRGYQFVRQKSYDKCDEVVDSMPPVPNGFCIEQSLVVFHISLNKTEPTLDIDDDHGDPDDELRVRNDEVDRTLTLYMCATMWHETSTEMTQMLGSILKLDEEHARRLGSKKVDQLRFRLEGHIFFDDAWEDRTEFGITKRVPNDFFRTFFETLSELTGEFVDESGLMMSRILVNTPYGGRLVVKLPAGTLLFVHLKDKKLIRHKKRWSQVMYMYYLLGHRIMDSPLSIEDRQQMAENTFILAIDGDSKFEPEAVMRLLNLMNTKNDIGCACGRIHPIGSGAAFIGCKQKCHMLFSYVTRVT
ncbi:unnamed protein product [Heligmosomoides polygyrus]|uniref:Chitin synthase n=1 Tax=Heligmosomoides polygyrus TaxID=6339 RepID=A0A183FWH8_HELPZ|nr:unnamed protein product [Heligmosomoides polygyrus]